jgi:hypothetical protein
MDFSSLAEREVRVCGIFLTRNLHIVRCRPKAV